MTKSFKHFRIQFGGQSNASNINENGKPVYKYSVYMQSRDNTWINRNLKDDQEASEEDQEITD